MSFSLSRFFISSSLLLLLLSVFGGLSFLFPRFSPISVLLVFYPYFLFVSFSLSLVSLLNFSLLLLVFLFFIFKFFSFFYFLFMFFSLVSLFYLSFSYLYCSYCCCCCLLSQCCQYLQLPVAVITLTNPQQVTFPQAPIQFALHSGSRLGDSNVWLLIRQVRTPVSQGYRDEREASVVSVFVSLSVSGSLVLMT